MPSQSTSDKPLNARIRADIHQALKVTAARSGRSMREIIEESLIRACGMHDRAESADAKPVDPAA